MAHASIEYGVENVVTERRIEKISIRLMECIMPNIKNPSTIVGSNQFDPNGNYPWVKLWAGTTDMYHAGEYMVWTDGTIKKCLRDTVYSPDEYAADWEDVD